MEPDTKSLFLESKNLLPIERAIYYHAVRINLLVAQLKCLRLLCLNLICWVASTGDDGLVVIKKAT